ncbi:hypothetical protein LRY29_00710 [Candidatus Saccharibacteria bacterium]|nr:hypothetical protein [Candidatus Saccharibacteria bacterium]
MRISDTTLETVLGRANLATPEQIATLKDEAVRSKRPMSEVLTDQKIVDERSLVKAFADYSGIPFVEIDPQSVPSDVLQLIPERVARQYMAVLFKVDENGVHHLAMEDPDDVQAVNFMQKEIGTNSQIYVATHDNILSVLEMYRGDVDKELDEVINIQRENDESQQDEVTEQDISEDSPIAQTVNLLLEYAIRSHASDVHIEPREEAVQVRYRIDGVLKET